MGGKIDVVKGRIEEAAGALTGNEKLREKGKADQAVGKVELAAQRTVGEAKKAAQKTVGEAKKAAAKAVAKVRKAMQSVRE
jgi:uncharacterized protein YjbJ (UPF0337 family)